QRTAQSEDQRHEQILEARAGSVARDRGGSETAGERRADHDGEVGGRRHERGHGADAQDLPEEWPPKARRTQRWTQHAPARPEIGGERQGTQCVIGNERERAARDPERRKRSPAEDERRRERNQDRKSTRLNS